MTKREYKKNVLVGILLLIFLIAGSHPIYELSYQDLCYGHVSPESGDECTTFTFYFKCPVGRTHVLVVIDNSIENLINMKYINDDTYTCSAKLPAGNHHFHFEFLTVQYSGGGGIYGRMPAEGEYQGPYVTPGCEGEEEHIVIPIFIDIDNDGYTSDEDCDDHDLTVHPGAPEICDGKDNDCDGRVDEGYDDDGDGYSTCEGDCDDYDSTVYPGAEEVYDGKDNDCDGETDEGTHIEEEEEYFPTIDEIIEAFSREEAYGIEWEQEYEKASIVLITVNGEKREYLVVRYWRDCRVEPYPDIEISWFDSPGCSKYFEYSDFDYGEIAFPYNCYNGILIIDITDPNRPELFDIGDYDLMRRILRAFIMHEARCWPGFTSL